MSIKLWEQPPLFDKAITNEENIGCPSLDSYVIEDGDIHSCIIVLPGGGYTHRADHEGGNVARELNRLGISAFVLNYRVAPYTFPVELADAKRAVRYVRYNAQGFGIDPERIGIMGFSAGGHLACLTAEYYDKFELEKLDDIDSVSARPDLLCLCYPVITAGRDISHKGSAENLLGGKTDYTEDISCEANIRRDMPPVFMWHTVEDKSVDCTNSILMAQRLKAYRIPFELHIFPDGRHGSDLAAEIEGTRQWFSLYADWLKRNDFCI